MYELIAEHVWTDDRTCMNWWQNMYEVMTEHVWTDDSTMYELMTDLNFFLGHCLQLRKTTIPELFINNCITHILLMTYLNWIGLFSLVSTKTINFAIWNFITNATVDDIHWINRGFIFLIVTQKITNVYLVDHII